MNLCTVFCLETNVDSICPGERREPEPAPILLCLLALHVGPLPRAKGSERGDQQTVPTLLSSLRIPQPGPVAGDWQGFN